MKIILSVMIKTALTAGMHVKCDLEEMGRYYGSKIIQIPKMGIGQGRMLS